MNLAEEYRRQFEWRSWPDLVAALPPLDGATVLDLGCGVGDQAALLEAYADEAVAAVRDDLLACLGRSDHRSTATIRFCLATTPTSAKTGAATASVPGGGARGPSRSAP